MYVTAVAGLKRGTGTVGYYWRISDPFGVKGTVTDGVNYAGD